MASPDRLMANDYSKDTLVEQPSIALLAELRWTTANCYHETFGPDGTLGRESSSEVVLLPQRRASRQRLNFGLPEQANDSAIEGPPRGDVARHVATPPGVSLPTGASTPSNAHPACNVSTRDAPTAGGRDVARRVATSVDLALAPNAVTHRNVRLACNVSTSPNRPTGAGVAGGLRAPETLRMAWPRRPARLCRRMRLRVVMPTQRATSLPVVAGARTSES